MRPDDESDIFTDEMDKDQVQEKLRKSQELSFSPSEENSNGGYEFEMFTKPGARAGSYEISYNGSGSFGLMSGFYNKENIKNFKKVVLFFDKNRNAVAFKFTNDEDALGAFAVIHAANQSTGAISARSFAISNDIYKSELRGRKTPKKIKDPKFGELFVIELTPDVPVG